MSRLARASFLALALASLLLATTGCHDRRTLLFLQLQANGGVSDVHSIDVQFTLAGKSASVKLREKSGTAIAFPTGDIIDIGSGAGTIAVTATARDGSGNQLAVAAGTTTIAAGESSALTLVFGGGDGDGDAGMPPDDGNLAGSAANLAGADLSVVAPDLSVVAPDLAAPVATDLAAHGDLAAGVPGAPTNPKALAFVLSAQVTWTPPPSNGASIVAYTITSSPENVVAVAYPPATSVMIYGLRQAESYDFTITATNDVGTGPPSIATNVVNIPPNLALSATVLKASSTFSGYSVSHINDGNVSSALGGAYSWSNDYFPVFMAPQWVKLDFATAITPTEVHFYTTAGYELANFDIQMGDGTTFTTVAAVSGNTAAYRDLPLTPLSGTALRVLCNSGSATQSTQARVNEVEIY